VIGYLDGLYHHGSFNDRLLLGLKGTISEAELHMIRQRLDGGIRNKAKRDEMRRGLAVGFVWGEEDGDVLLDPDEAVHGAIATIFERFAEPGSARQARYGCGLQRGVCSFRRVLRNCISCEGQCSGQLLSQKY
jgi:DNA invertase Pin-like site-specific DNA recombinase